MTLVLLESVGCGDRSYAPDPSGPAIDAQAFRASVTRLREEHRARAVISGAWRGAGPGVQFAIGDSLTGVPATTDMTVRIGGISQFFLGTLLMRRARPLVIYLIVAYYFCWTVVFAGEVSTGVLVLPLLLLHQLEILALL